MNKNIKKNKTQEYHHYTFQRLKKKKTGVVIKLNQH